MTTVRRILTQKIDVPAGNLYPEGVLLLSNNTIIDNNGVVISGSGGNTTVSVISIDGGNANGGGGIIEQPNTGNVGLSTRVVVNTDISSIAANGVTAVNVGGFKSYQLYNVTYGAPGWIRLYTTSNARSADANRAIGVDPVPGSGVLAEVVTTANNTTFTLTPPVVGFNGDVPASNTIYVLIKNISNTTTSAATLSLTLLQTEA